MKLHNVLTNHIVCTEHMGYALYAQDKHCATIARFVILSEAKEKKF